MHLPCPAKRLAVVLAAFISMTQVRRKAEIIASALVIDSATAPFEHILYIYHQIRFKKDQAKVKALLNSGSKINAMTPAFIAKQCLKV